MEDNEITVEIDTNLENLEKILKENNFKINEIYDIYDIYFVNKDIDIKDNFLEILNKCILIRDIVETDHELKLITYKFKEYNNKNEIVSQKKFNCKIESISEAVDLLKALNYKELIKINNHQIVYSNGEDEMVVQMVNNKHIYIEIEQKCNYAKKYYQNIEEMKDVIKRYNIPIKNNDFFMKKAEIELKEIYRK